MKRKMLAIVLSALSAAASSFAADWPQYRGPEHDGKSAEAIGPWPAAGLRQIWKTGTPGGFSSFAVKEGRAFTLISREVEGAPREVLIALDAETGKELWAAPFGSARYGHDGGNAGAPDNAGGDGPRSTPSVDSNRVYVMTADLLLACLDAATGKEVWKRDLMRQHQGDNISWKNAASPLVDGNLVFVAGGGPGQALMGIDKATGQVVWKGQDDKMTHATPAIGEIHGVRQVIFFTQKGLVSVNPGNGEVLWRHSHPYRVSTAASPVICGEIVYCSAGYGVGAAAVQISKAGAKFSVKELWRVTGDKLANHWSTPIYRDGYLYGMFQFKEYGGGPVKCIDVRTGQEKWSKQGFGPGNVLLAGDQLIILGDAGQLVLAEATPTAYRERARFDALEGKCWSTPALANGKLFVRSTREGAAFDVSAKLAQP
jgi:outer membrane protein assembly factor BamB